MKRSGRAFTTALIAGAYWIGLVPIANAQPPLRIGASLAQTARMRPPARTSFGAAGSA